jgi:hypothetical protein
LRSPSPTPIDWSAPASSGGCGWLSNNCRAPSWSPSARWSELQANYSVFVVRPDNTAEFRKVTPGPRVGNLRVITAGLSAGEKVVVEGIQKLQNNTPVAPTLKPLATPRNPPPPSKPWLNSSSAGPSWPW